MLNSAINTSVDGAFDHRSLPLTALALEGDGVVLTEGGAAGLSRHADPIEPRSLLSRLTAFVVRLPKSAVQWVAGLIEGLSTRFASQFPRSVSGRSLECLADGSPLTSGVLEQLAAEGGELRRLYSRLEWIGLHGGDEFAPPARELLEVDIEGIAAREWALGGSAATRLVKQCGECTQVYLGKSLGKWGVSVQGLFDAAYSSKPPVTALEVSSLLEGLQLVPGERV